ncbi:hypothetical protein AKJ18_13890 [Vibrio xuii]|nr:hypothetical protein AKJ18_13890 [Vibrio xuii]
MTLYCVSDWRSYHLVQASSSLEALFRAYGKQYQPIDNSKLNEDTVVHGMCCEYVGDIELLFEILTLDIDRVLLLDAYSRTERFEILSKNCPNC